MPDESFRRFCELTVLLGLDAVGDGLGISHDSKLGDLRRLGPEPAAKGGEDRRTPRRGGWRRWRGGSDGVAQRVSQDADQCGHFADLDGGGGHAHSVAPMAQDDLSLLVMPRDPQACSLTTSIGDVETIRVPTHPGEYEPVRRRCRGRHLDWAVG